MPVVGVGKIDDIFDGRGITESVHTEGNADGLAKTEALLGRVDRGLVFANLVDFDMLYGHRNDPAGYARALEAFDACAAAAARPARARRPPGHHRRPRLRPDHALHRPLARVRAAAGLRGAAPEAGRSACASSFADVGATVAEWLGVAPRVGESFAARLAAEAG